METEELGVSCCSLYSCPLQYETNKLKILQSIKECKQLNCFIRVGGELEICGVNCKDSFKEIEDINENCWKCLCDIINETYEGKYMLNNILCFITMPIFFGEHIHSCALAIYNREILFISPKNNVSDDEKNYFSSYKGALQNEKEETEKKEKRHNHTTTEKKIEFKNCHIEFLSDQMEKFLLPEIVQQTLNQRSTYFGDASIQIAGAVISHFFLNDVIIREYSSIQKGSWGDHHEMKWNGKREHFINTEEQKNNSNTHNNNEKDTTEVSNTTANVKEEDDNCNKGVSLFQKKYMKLKINEKIKFDQIDILLISGYIQNEMHLFKSYFIELMNISKKFPNIIISFNNNTGCDNNFYTFDGFSFVAQGGKILTKNARFAFSEIQVASVGVSLSTVLSKETNEKCGHTGTKIKQCEQKNISLFKINSDIIPTNEQYQEHKQEQKQEKKETNTKEKKCATDKKKCIFLYHEDLPISIKNASDTITQHLPDNFNWMHYTQMNRSLFTFFKSFHDDMDKNVVYQFNGKQLRLHNCYEEISFNCALFLWHILHLTNSKGFMLAISGGVDSSFVACMVYLLSIMLELRLQNCMFDSVNGKWQTVFEQEKKKAEDKEEKQTASKTETPLDEQLFLKKVSSLLIEDNNRKHICNKLLNTISLPSKHSSSNTQEYAEILSKEINSYHITYPIDKLYQFYKDIGEEFLNKKLQFKSEGGSNYEDMCLQNIQSRNRMLLVYFFNTLVCHKKYMNHNLPNEFLLTLATGNLDESVLGYYTKYDCSSGDINIIGNISKLMIKEILCQLANDPFYDIPILNKINCYQPSAELKPLETKQTDETDLQLKYTEIKLLTLLKNIFHLGPISMFYYLSNYLWCSLSPNIIIQKIQNFFTRILKNTHKIFILPPSINGEPCGLNSSVYVHHGIVDFKQCLINRQNNNK